MGGARALTWVETSAADFGDGVPDNGLYASHLGDGAVEFVGRFDLNNDGYIDLVCPDDSGPYLRVYFGSPTGYDSANSRYFPMSGGGGVDMADLDADGFAELIHSGWHSRTMTIYWGTDSGPSPGDTTQLATVGRCEAVYAFDLDHDTYLDLVCATDTSTVTIFWGNAAGYSNSDTSIVALDGMIGQNLEVADFDQDGWADIAAVSWTRNANPVIYWGPGRREREVKWLKTADGKSHGVTTADLDRDGWLDLVYTSYDNGTTAFIYYGGERGFSRSHFERIFPGQSFGGTVASYWDGDSSLDLVFFRGEYRGTPDWVPLVYFNQPEDPVHFDDSHRANIGSTGFNASGGLVADFDRDGAQDVFVDNFRQNDGSSVLWGPSYTSRTVLPSNKSHHGVAREVGSVYDRRFQETYVSSVFYAGDSVRWQSVTWDDSTPGSSSIQMEVHTGNTPEPGPEWQEWQTFNKGDPVPSNWWSSRIQYRATFRYDNPAVLPALKQFRVDYDSVVILDVGVKSVIAPFGTLDSGVLVTPRVVVRNYGNRPAFFPLTLTIGDSYSRSVQVENLLSLTSDTMLFPQWVAEPGQHLVTSFCVLPRDTNHWNDTLRDTILVRGAPRPDVGATVIFAPADSVDSGMVIVPNVVVRSFGTLPARFPVVMSIGSAYVDTIYDSLGPGKWDTAYFRSWTALERGTSTITCFTNLAGDGDRSNDTVRGRVVVGPTVWHDVGVERIIAPGLTARAGDTLRPRVLVRNYGVRTERLFKVRFLISAAYARVATVDTGLAPGDSVVVAFPDWVATTGTYTVSCSTMLALDLDRSNDKKTQGLDVSRYSTLTVEPDQRDTIASDTAQTYWFYAKLESDSARVVDLARSEAPPGWVALLYDSAGVAPLGTSLGLLSPGDSSWFSLRVTAPTGDLSGVLDTLSAGFVVTAVVRGDTTTHDSAALELFLAPGLTIHNFPNPCVNSTRFIIGVPGQGTVTLTLYDRAGALVRRLSDAAEVQAGVLLVDWDGTNDAGRPVASGAYRFILDYSAGGTSTTIVKKLVLVRE